MNTKYQIPNTKYKSGQVMILTVVLISSAILSATSLAGLLIIYQLRQSTDIVNSAKAIFVADSGIECSLYKYNPSDPLNPRVIDCSKWNLSNKASFTTVMVGATTVRSVGSAGNSARAFEMDFSSVGSIGPGFPPLWVCGDILIDVRNKKPYDTVQIGSQCWMKQSMNIGTRIAGTADQTNNGIIEKYCYDNSDANCVSNDNPNYPDGGLYQRAEAIQYAASCNGTGESQPACSSPVQGICPAGWHIPSHYEWVVLERAVCTSGTCAIDFPYDGTTGWRGTDEGVKLKPNGSSHFEGNLAGYREADGIFYNRRSWPAGLFWSSSADSWRRQLNWGGQVQRDISWGGSHGCSVRCVKN